jgi:cellulose synthase (UDP-forming)
VQPSRALNNTAIFAGSCGLIRRSALDKIGGFPEYIIEDTFFSFESDMHNYTSIYIPKVYAYGKPITTFTELVKQQWRYNYGDTQFMMYY